MIRIGVCGLGLRVGQLIRESLNACNIDFRVVGVVDPDEPRVRSLMRAEDRDAKFFSSADEMIRSVKPDALMVGTRCHLHTPYALELYAPSELHLDLRLLTCYILAQPRTTGGRHGTRRTRLLGGATVRILGQRSDDSRIQRAEGAALRKYPPLDPSVAKGTPG